MAFAAHIRQTDGKEQTVAEHVKGVAALSKKYAANLDVEHLAVLQGLLHDAGKLNSDFTCYIHGNSHFRRGKIDHCFAGAKYLCAFAESHLAKKTSIYQASRLAARAILSHHGLHDWLTEDGTDYFQKRTQKEERYDEIQPHIAEMLSELGYSEEDQKELIEKAAVEFKDLFQKLRKLRDENRKNFPLKDKQESQYAKIEFVFYLGMLERLLESILIDADRTDTANFMGNCQTEQQFHTSALWEQMEQNINAKLKGFSRKTDPISRQRQDISERCFQFAEKAEKPVGACRLIVPTGGGKTLASLRFAIHACKKFHGKKIVYVAPFMSILEQNSSEIRELAGAENFLEHHSNMLAEKETEEELREYELRTEKWDVPVLATTMVQFLQALFSGSSASVRRMHQLCQAVIIVDEIQSIPLKCVYLFDLAVNFLTHVCGCTVVLCSATQPTLEKLAYPLLLDENFSMTGSYEKDFAVFRRTELIRAEGHYSYAEAAGFCWEKFQKHGSLLVIVNTKKAAESLFRQLQEWKNSGEKSVQLIHLSTSMCPAHREVVIEGMRKSLQDQEPVLCVTTQLIEAGVDISFRCVVRSLAGLSNIAQAAGRCNRHGEMGKICPVYLLELTEENLSRLPEIHSAQDVSRLILDNKTDCDFLSAEAIAVYFRKLYHENKDTLSYPVYDEDRKTSLLDLLSLDKMRAEAGVRKKEDKIAFQAFATAGSLFHVIDDAAAQDLIVPYNADAKELILQLNGDTPAEELQRLLRRSQRYTVSVYTNVKKQLEGSGGIYPLRCGALALEERFYDTEALGLITEVGDAAFLNF